MASSETFVEAWDLFKCMLVKCPTHGQPHYVLVQIFYQGVNDTIRARLDLATNCEFIVMELAFAWELVERLTFHDTRFATSLNPTTHARGLYEVSRKVDKDIRAQAYLSENKRLNKMLAAIKGCQLCNQHGHVAAERPHANQVQAVENFVNEEVMYSKDYRNSGL